MSIRDQIAAYNAADYLVFADGSALHLYALVAKPEQRAFVIWRRKVNSVFTWQVETFGGPRLGGKSCVKELWVRDHEPIETVQGKAVLNFPILRTQLIEAGMIGGATWQYPTDSEQQEALAALSNRLKWKFALYEIA